ncbi:fasciclin domain-containing protein [Pseudonocardia yuanmonensis]|uniref:Fasciclin domain-containing protein n=1 Tax=Pseudonocardia yuanmonensis TaxID=1095914 RepID=A0ABP8XQU6_9PSEU
MRSIQRLVTLGAAAAAVVVLGACSAPSQEPSSATDVPPVPTVAAAGPTTPAVPGSTTAAEVFGPGCASLPTGDDPGSLSSMRLQPVAAAVETNPELTTLNDLIGRANLAGPLNAAPELTVFAPTNDAFAKLPAEQRAALEADPARLATVLEYHVSGTRASAEELRAAGTSTELAGGQVRIGGTGDAMTVSDASGGTANVVCGNVPTGNATVFLIDTVLVPQA